MRLLLCFLLTPLLSVAQLTGSLSREDGLPLAGATLTIRRGADSTVLKYTLTNAQGRYLVSGLPAGELLLTATYAGLRARDTSFFWEGTRISLPVWVMRPAAAELAEARVNVRKPLFEVQPDKTVFHLGQSIAAGTGTAFEALQKAPGVLIDPNDAISLQGRTGVRMHIDGRPSPLSVSELAAWLRTLPAAEVETIELITNPSARYEAAGNAGIINIRLKKNKNFGTNGSVQGGWAVGIFPKYNAAFSANHRNRKWNFFGSLSANRSRSQSFLHLNRLQNDTTFDQRALTIGADQAGNLRAGADWFISGRSTLGVLVQGATSLWEGNTQSRTPIASLATKEALQTLEAGTVARRARGNGSVNLNYRYSDSLGRNLSVDADYSDYRLDARTVTTNRYADRSGMVLSSPAFSSQTPVSIRFAAIQATWEQKWAGGTFTAGLRSATARSENQFDFYNRVGTVDLADEERSNQFQYDETIHAVFGQYQRSIRAWNYQFGMRLEQTLSTGTLSTRGTQPGQVVRRSYLSAFPSFGVTRTLPGHHQLGISVSRRIDRPSYQDLNPFENRLDELSYQKGNPFLRPQFTNSVEFKHSWKYKLNTTLSFAGVHDFFAAITDTIEGRRSFITQRNLARQRVYGLSTGMPFQLRPWWSGYVSAGVNHSRYRAVFGVGKEVRINATVANLYQQHSFRVNSRWSAELSSFYLSPYVWAGNYECRAIWNIDAGVQFKFAGEQGTLRLSVTDIFQTLPWEGTSRLGSLFIAASGGWESRQLRLNASFRFGNRNVKAARQRSSAVEDLNRRVQ